MTSPAAALFLGHGNPLYAIQPNPYAARWAALGTTLPRPRAVLMVSAHWYAPGVAVTAMARPPILYDFHGFPPELYQLAYPAAGAPDLARRVAALLAPDPVVFDTARGLDHGAWSVLLHLWPQADVPVVQLRLDRARRPADHVRLAARLAPLRDEGVMVIGSGNVVHNLRAYRWDRGLMAEPYDWALRFERQVRERIAAGDLAGLADYLAIGPDAALAVPTPEHYLPLLYVLALRRPDDPVRFPSEGMDGGAVSMLAVQVG